MAWPPWNRKTGTRGNSRRGPTRRGTTGRRDRHGHESRVGMVVRRARPGGCRRPSSRRRPRSRAGCRLQRSPAPQPDGRPRRFRVDPDDGQLAGGRSPPRVVCGRGVESTTGAVAVGDGGSCSRRLSPVAGASLRAVAPFPVAAHRTGRAAFPHPALGRDHAFAHGKLAVRGARCVSPYSDQSRSAGKRRSFPVRTLCLRPSHWRSRRVACRSIAT